ncbi:Nucleotide-binding, alpha-beta plait [Heracleum sosnowskyi]|uniref:Large ribosomal subunit protein uL23m n=1 Tax=Heracleum sosnowskyi TaxID=360622 RepID=A0AAD8H8Q5_9APIA|nr:Nucleotide-binding, alpha-beta plait [Heracleum sosnowskyi]
MGSRLGRRVVNFANLPIKLLMPTSFSNITEIALKTIPSASKIEIKRVLESLYGFEVEKVQTLNMDGKKKKRGGILIAKPDYKKAYVTLRNPLSISPDLFPIRIIEEDKKNLNKQSKSSFVEGDEAKKKSHWLEGNGKPEVSGGGRWRGRDRGGHPGGGRDRGGHPGGGRDRGASQGGAGSSGQVKFPWSSMKSSSR